MTLPVFRKLKNQSGREIEFNIVGRTNSDIYTIRMSDSLKSRVPISSLSPEDQMFALSLPIVAPPQSFAGEDEIAKASGSGSNQMYIANRKKEIERLELLNEKLAEELQSSSNKIQSRSKRSEIQRNTVEIERLKSQIADFRLQK